MLPKIIKNLFGTRNSRLLKEYKTILDKINFLENKYASLNDIDLKNYTIKLKQEYKQDNNFEKILPDAFAIVREASKRVLGLRHYDEQIIGGIALHQGKIAEMKTGEGKTLVATLPAYLNALSDKSVFIITVNDYLAQRDAEWMGKIYNFLGLSVGTITNMIEPKERKNMYQRDIVYGTNNEFGFDYLRDNMIYNLDDKVQGQLKYGIVDEVDSVLVDEARTPLVISGSKSENNNLYQKINKITKQLMSNKQHDLFYVVDEKQKTISLTEEGHKEVEHLLVQSKMITSSDDLYLPKNIQLLHHIDASLRANLIFKINIDYVIENNQVVIIDEFSGRKMPGRRWAEGLHQAIEAKENVTIQNENLTYASITFQNYFRLFDKLAGMTGTADTEAVEFQQIYGLEVVVIPPHKEMIRNDEVDLVYLSIKEKFRAIVDKIINVHETQQPILVGTTSIESSENISKLLKQKKINHSVLNAKYHQKEAEIIAQAGKLGSVTIATNMAGRGTDIVLGGNYLFESENNSGIKKSEWEKNHEQVKKLGGLYIIGTERHESRRVDNQLRGRSGRQGDPGVTRFYLSLEDNLMRIFASEKVSEIMKKLGMQEGEAIEHKWVAKSIENAQKRVEAHNFDIRKTLLEYDDISNEQRKVIYNQRDQILSSENLNNILEKIVFNTVENILFRYLPLDMPISQWQFDELEKNLNDEYLISINLKEIHEKSSDDNARDFLSKQLIDKLMYKITLNLDKLPDIERNELIRNIILSILDDEWRSHLSAMDYLRQGIGLRGYAQKNPKNEYKKESFEMFEEMLTINNHEITKVLCKINIKNKPLNQIENNSNYNKIDNTSSNSTNNKIMENIPRNALCPCGSGKKYKRCCGKLQ
ncbi:MAG: preprotein translocase subunit SecA [Gammaproteobacteria bacterium]|nr:preprotein translocase subunit SecA [Gammaproteobacteria bacterium]